MDTQPVLRYLHNDAKILYKVVVAKHFFSSLSCGSSISMCAKSICFFAFYVMKVNVIRVNNGIS